jgi:transposase
MVSNNSEIEFIKGKKRVGRSAYSFEVLMKLYIYGFINKISSSRDLELETHRNIEVMFLLKDLKPDHKTIANYRKNNKKALKEVLVQSAQLCMELNLIDGNILFLDGSKIRGNSSINKTRTKEGLEKQLKQIEEMVEELIKESDKIDKLEEGQTVKLTEELSTTQSRKKKIEEAIKKIKETENRNINITDNESVMIKGRQGTHSGYNAQMVVDEKNGLIVSSNVVSKSNDLGQFSREIKNANEVLGKKCKTACADAGYFDLKVDCQHFFVQLLFGHICKTIFYWSHVFQSTVNTFIIVP